MQKSSTHERIIYGIILSLFCAICIIPIIAVLSISLSSDKEIIMNGYSLLPRGFSLEGYKFVFKDYLRVLSAYGVSIFTTIAGTVLGLILNAMMAYVLSRPNYGHRSKLTVYLTIPMVLSGGLVPTYMLITQFLHLKNNPLVLILPIAVVPWYIIMMRTFFAQIPYELSEAAIIDGAGELRIFWQVILPLAKPALATVGIFLALAYWNDWYNCMLFISNDKLFTLQYYLQRMLGSASAMRMVAEKSGMAMESIPLSSMQMAMTVIETGPIILLYPFIQKYFGKGLTR